MGRGGGGDSQQRAEEMKRKLDPYYPLCHEGVTLVHKHGMALLWDPWYNKGRSDRVAVGITALLALGVGCQATQLFPVARRSCPEQVWAEHAAAGITDAQQWPHWRHSHI